MNYSRFLFLLLSASCCVTAMQEKVPEWEELGVSNLYYTQIISLKDQFAHGGMNDDILASFIFLNYLNLKCKKEHVVDVITVLKEYSKKKDIQLFYQLLHNVKQSEQAFKMFASKKNTTESLVSLLFGLSGVALKLDDSLDEKSQIVLQQVKVRVQKLQTCAQAGDFQSFVKESGTGLSYCDEIIEQLNKG